MKAVINYYPSYFVNIAAAAGLNIYTRGKNCNDSTPGDAYSIETIPMKHQVEIDNPFQTSYAS